jgi:hypothetical protein
MFLKVKHGGNEKNPHDYLQIVESYRPEGAQHPRQRVLANLGRLDHLIESGKIDRLIEGLARFTEQMEVRKAAETLPVEACQSKVWGPALVFGRLWREQRLPEVLGKLAAGRKFGFDFERVVFAMALQRLCAPGSDLFGSTWLPTVEAPGFEAIQLQHLYRAVRLLGERREDLERELFLRDRDLFGQDMDLLFVDTTSVYVYRDTETEFRRRGYSRDRRGDLPQLVLCVAVDQHGWPVAWEAFPGNTADKPALLAMIEVFRKRFGIRRAIVVADRGMISQKAIDLLTDDAEAPFGYILGCRMRGSREVHEEVLGRAGRYQVVAENLQVKEVRVGQRRYIVCRNPEEAARDAAQREAILADIRDKTKREQKALLKNQGYKRYVTIDKGALKINAQTVADDARLDGKWVLRTNTDLPADQVAESYKSLWRVERTFRECKSTLQMRPIYHQLDETSIGHLVACFLALRLEVHLARRLSEKGVKTPWRQLMQDLSGVQAVRLRLEGKDWLLRTGLPGQAHAAFMAAGVQPPPSVTTL